MKWLVAMEFSGRVRDALRALGHDAWSCDFRPCESDPRWHLQQSVFDNDVVNAGWDGMIAHPDCTFLTVAGARWMKIPWRAEAQQMALYTVRALWEFPVKHKAIENPISRLSTLWKPPTQVVRLHWFGVPEFKATCLWLDQLPPLEPTNMLEVPEKGTEEWKSWNKVHRESPGKDRAKNRSRTRPGLAQAFAMQWGNGNAQTAGAGAWPSSVAA